MNSRAWNAERTTLESVPERLRPAGQDVVFDAGAFQDLTRLVMGKVDEVETATCIAVVGEFRTGKSSLINALAGGTVAFVDVVEATATMCSYAWGEHPQAVIHRHNAEPEMLSPADANALLAHHRHDAAWVERIAHVAFTAPLPALRGIELWDAPGFGGSERNDATANAFVDRITGALWVLDATLLGSASIVPPLQRLKAAGKRVVAVVNRIDRLDDIIEIVEATAFVNDTYGDLFSDILAISARDALAAQQDGRKDPTLLTLRAAVDELVASAASDRERRVGAGVVEAADTLRREVHRERVVRQDILGLLEHTDQNLRLGATRLLHRLLPVIEAEVDAAFATLESKHVEIWRQKAKAKDGVSASDLETVLQDIAHASSLQFVADAVVVRAQTFIDIEWRRVGSHATDHATNVGRQLTLHRKVGAAAQGSSSVAAGISSLPGVRLFDQIGNELAEASIPASVATFGGAAMGGLIVALSPLTVAALPMLFTGAVVAGLAAGAWSLVSSFTRSTANELSLTEARRSFAVMSRSCHDKRPANSVRTRASLRSVTIFMKRSPTR